MVERDACEMPLRPFSEHGHLRDEIRAGLEVAHRLVLAPAALVAGAHADDAPVRDEQRVGGGLRQDHRAAFLRALAEPASELREREDPVAVVLHRRRRRNAQRISAGQHVDRLAVHRAERGQVLDAIPVLEEAPERARVDHCTGEQVRAGLLALFDDGDGHVPETLCDLGVLLEQLAETDRAGEPSRSGTDDEHADLDPLVDRIGRLRDELPRRERRRVVGRADGHDLRWFTSSVSFGTISCTSPTTPRSLNSKMGAFGSLLIATITFELCMPTLCWIAPEMPSAT